MTTPERKLILVVYGDSPQSTRARENITAALDARGIDPRTLETIDVMANPQWARELQTAAAPQLIIGDVRSNRSMYGDLSDRERLDRWLDEMLEPVDSDRSTTP